LFVFVIALIFYIVNPQIEAPDSIGTIKSDTRLVFWDGLVFEDVR